MRMRSLTLTLLLMGCDSGAGSDPEASAAIPRLAMFTMSDADEGQGPARQTGGAPLTAAEMHRLVAEQNTALACAVRPFEPLVDQKPSVGADGSHTFEQDAGGARTMAVVTKEAATKDSYGVRLAVSEKDVAFGLFAAARNEGDAATQLPRGDVGGYSAQRITAGFRADFGQLGSAFQQGAGAMAGNVAFTAEHEPGASLWQVQLKDYAAGECPAGGDASPAREPNMCPTDSGTYQVHVIKSSTKFPGKTLVLARGAASRNVLVKTDACEREIVRVRRVVGSGGWGRATFTGGDVPAGNALVFREVWTAAAGVIYRRSWICPFANGELTYEGCSFRVLPAFPAIGGAALETVMDALPSNPVSPGNMNDLVAGVGTAAGASLEVARAIAKEGDPVSDESSPDADEAGAGVLTPAEMPDESSLTFQENVVAASGAPVQMLVTQLTSAELGEQDAIVNARRNAWATSYPTLSSMPMMIIVVRKNGADTRFYPFGCRRSCIGESCIPGACLDTSGMDKNTVFELGSVSKTFTATLAAEMSSAAVPFTAAHGRLQTFSVDSTLDAFWNHQTDGRNASSTPIANLISHWSGLATDPPAQDTDRAELYKRAFMPNATSGAADSGDTTCWGMSSGWGPPEDCLQPWGKDPAHAQPGAYFRYSNFAYDLLGNILGDVGSGTVNNTTAQSSWLAVLNTRLLAPMNTKGYEQTAPKSYPAGPPPGDIARTYSTDGMWFYDGVLAIGGSPFSPPELTAWHAGTGLWMSAGGVAKWMRFAMSQWSSLPPSLTPSDKAAVSALYNSCYEFYGGVGARYTATVGGSTPVSSTGPEQQVRQGNGWEIHYDGFRRVEGGVTSPVVTLSKSGAVSFYASRLVVAPPYYPAPSDCAATPNSGVADGLGVAMLFGGYSTVETDGFDLAYGLADSIFADLLTTADP